MKMVRFVFFGANLDTVACCSYSDWRVHRCDYDSSDRELWYLAMGLETGPGCSASLEISPSLKMDDVRRTLSDIIFQRIDCIIID